MSPSRNPPASRLLPVSETDIFQHAKRGWSIRQQLAWLQEASLANAASFVDSSTVNATQLLDTISPQILQNASLGFLSPASLSTASIFSQQPAPGVSGALPATTISDLSPNSSPVAETTDALRCNDDEVTRDKKPKVSIRKDQVEAALRSKPQRGRKRSDLNEEERMELTRTRNRFHAKSTRARKKARYEELLHCEEQLQHLLKNQELPGQRRQTVIDYLAMRTCMVRASFWSSSSSSSEAKSTLVSNQAGEQTPPPIKQKEELEHVKESNNNFTFREDTDAHVGANKLDSMIHARLEGRYGKSALSLLSYKVKGSDNGIALSLLDTGFAEVELILSSDSSSSSSSSEDDRKQDILASFMLRFQFAKDSHKLSSVVWMTGKWKAINDDVASNGKENQKIA